MRFRLARRFSAKKILSAKKLSCVKSERVRRPRSKLDEHKYGLRSIMIQLERFRVALNSGES